MGAGGGGRRGGAGGGCAVRLYPLHRGQPAEAAVGREGWIPARVRLADYPQLKQLAWQVRGVDRLTPREALDIYERNERQLDPETLTPAEAQLIEALRLALS